MECKTLSYSSRWPDRKQGVVRNSALLSMVIGSEYFGIANECRNKTSESWAEKVNKTLTHDTEGFGLLI